MERTDQIGRIIAERDVAKRHCATCGGYMEAPPGAMAYLTCHHCGTAFCPPCGFNHFGDVIRGIPTSKQTLDYRQANRIVAEQGRN